MVAWTCSSDSESNPVRQWKEVQCGDIVSYHNREINKATGQINGCVDYLIIEKLVSGHVSMIDLSSGRSRPMTYNGTYSNLGWHYHERSDYMWLDVMEG